MIKKLHGRHLLRTLVGPCSDIRLRRRSEREACKVHRRYRFNARSARGECWCFAWRWECSFHSRGRAAWCLLFVVYLTVIQCLVGYERAPSAVQRVMHKHLSGAGCWGCACPWAMLRSPTVIHKLPFGEKLHVCDDGGQVLYLFSPQRGNIS